MKAFLITVDTEGDNLWARPDVITTRNALFLPRFQALCERHGLKPTWLVNHEMASCPVFVPFGRDVLRRRAGEIGMHLHAWNSPPLKPLTAHDHHFQPFLIEYPSDQMEEKIAHLTALLRDRFESDMVSHRAGRWALDARYAKLLVKHGYRIDCSVSPHVSWKQMRGAPGGCGGTDYTNFPTRPYWMDLDHIERPGSSDLLELPVSIGPSRLYRLMPSAYAIRGLRRLAWRHRPPHQWLYPDGRNLPAMVELLQRSLRDDHPYVELIIHSSELMPGGGPHCPDEASIESLYADLESLFRAAAGSFTGMTLSDFRQRWLGVSEPPRGVGANARRPRLEETSPWTPQRLAQ